MALFGSERTLAVAVTAKVDQYVTALKQADKATLDFTRKVEAAGTRTERAQRAGGLAASQAAKEQVRAARETERAAKQAAAAQEKAAREAKRASAEHKAAWQTVGEASAAAGAGLLVAVGGVVAAYARFDQQLSKVQAVSGATASEMRGLSAAALQAGKDTVFSASEAASAEAELAKVGLSASEIIGGSLKGALDLAAAGGLGLAESAEIAGKTMKTFGLDAKDVPSIADALAAGANKSAANVSDLSQALAQGGQVAHQTGLTMEDTVGVLAAFADNALLGSDAGTSLKTMLQRLSAPTDEAAGLMAKLGIDVYDARGNFVGITQVAGQLQKTMGNLTVEQRQQAMATIFGADAVRSASILYSLGADGLQTYVTGVKDVGAASRVATIQTNNLAGDFERLKGALETEFIGSGGAANDVLRKLAKGATDAVDAFGKLPGPVREGSVVVGLVAGAVLTLSGGLLVLLPRIAATKVALTELGVTGARTRGVMAGLGRALGAVAVAGTLDAIARTGDGAALSVDRTTSALLDLSRRNDLAALDKAFQGVSNYGEDNIRGLDDALRRLADPGLNGRLNKLSSTLTGGLISSGFEGIEDQFRAIGDSLAQMVDSGNADQAAAIFADIAKRAQTAGVSVEDLSALMPGYQDALARVANAQTQSGESAESAEDKIRGFSKSLDDLYAQTFGVAAAQDAFRGSLSAMVDQAKESKRQVKGNSEAARDLREKMRDTFRSALDVVEAFRRTGAGADKVAEKSKSVRDEFVRVALRAGISKDEVLKYAAAFDQIPAKKSTEIHLSGIDQAKAKIADLAEDIRGIPSLQAAIYRSKGAAPELRIPKPQRTRSRVVAKADGGFIPGPPSTSDSVEARLSTGEYVVRSAATSRIGVARLDYMNRTGRVPGFADGGHVTPRRFAAGGAVMPPRWVTAAAVTGGSAGGTTVIERHEHYHLDGAAVAGTARAYAAEVDRVQARRDRVATRYGAATT